MKYKVVSINGHPIVSDPIVPDDPHRAWAMDLRNTYGLDHLSIEVVQEIWEEHSDLYCAGWLMVGSKEEVEDVFKVTLEEIKEDD